MCYQKAVQQMAIGLVLLSLVACGVPVTHQPSSTPIPLTATSPDSPFISITPSAQQACAGAENAVPVGGALILPTLVLKKDTGQKTDWQAAPSEITDPDAIAADAASVKSLTCIQQDVEAESGFAYSNGSPAYDTVWNVWFINWPKGEVVGKISLVGFAPATKPAEGAGLGEPPVDDLVSFFHWVKTSPAIFEGGIVSQQHNKVVFSLETHLLAVIDDNGLVTVWDLAADTSLVSFATNRPERNLALSPDGTEIAVEEDTDSNTTTVFDTKSGKLLYTLGAGTPVFSPDGKYLVVADPRENYTTLAYEIWMADSGTGKIVNKIEHMDDKPISMMAFSANGLWLASASDIDSKVTVWDLKSKSPVGTYDHPGGWPRQIAISPNGQWIATLRDKLYVQAVKTGDTLYSSSDDLAQLEFVAFSPDGQDLVFSGRGYNQNDSVLYMLDLNTYHPVELSKQDFSPVNGLGFNVNNGKLYISLADGAMLAINYPP
ncbi:MAG TPA: hypothetical protein VMC09_18785 [Anaerolineales bacterium]|nr:hypothetical protein [Anaerolineales bacterium]